MKDLLQRVCDLQPLYSSENTAPMQERGALIRRALPDAVREMAPGLQAALGAFGIDFDIDASDGIGRKTHAPWVRFHSTSMSPSPREGFYVVLHFAADGSAAFVTVGCGSTIWANGELRPVPDEELNDRTSKARDAIIGSFGSLDPFVPEMALGGTAPLVRSFEKATVCALRFDRDRLTDEDLKAALVEAAKRLRVVYEAQRTGWLVRASEQVDSAISALSRPQSARSTGSQGFGLSADQRRAVELRAMSLARLHLERDGFTVVDRSSNSPFDLECRKGNQTIKVEVKGTTSVAADAVLMTRNEVDLHRQEKGATGLVIVSGIQLSTGADAVWIASGGQVEALIGWDIDEWAAEPIAFRMSRGRLK